MNKIDINTLEKLLNEGNAVFICGAYYACDIMSRPERGVWVEISLII